MFVLKNVAKFGLLMLTRIMKNLKTIFSGVAGGGGGGLGHWPPFLMKLNLKCNYNILKKYCKLCFKSSLIFTTFLFTTNFCADLNFDITSPQKALVIASYQCGGIKYLRVSIRVWSRDGEPFQVVGQI